MKVREPNRIVGVGGQAYPPTLPQGPAVLRSVVTKEVSHLLYRVEVGNAQGAGERRGWETWAPHEI